MVENKAITSCLAASASAVDDAVGVPDAKWFVAIVNNRSEKLSAERLTKMGIANYVPTLRELRVWKNGKRVVAEKVMIPSKVFVHCTEPERREIVNLPFIFRFMTNKARNCSNLSNTPLAVIPDFEIEQLKFMLGVPGANIAFTENFVKGDKVKVIRGPFKGLIGVVVEEPDSKKNRLYINIDCLGYASVEIDPKDVTPNNV